MKVENLKIFNGFTIALILFCFIEITFFDNPQLQLLFAIVEYLFCTLLLVANLKKGIIYFLSFTLLSVGIGNYTDADTLPNNFWGVRLGGFSFNILYSIIIVTYSLFINKKVKNYKLGIFYKFLIVLFCYGALIGIINVGMGNNYLDNYFSDFMTYFPFFIYFYLLKQLDHQDYHNIFFSTFISSIFLLLFAWIFITTFKYGNGNYLVQNTVCNIILITVFVIRKEIGNILFGFIVLFLFYLASQNLIFLSGKVIISLVLYLLIFSVKYKKGSLFLIPLLMFFLFQLESILDFLIDFFYGNTISFKLEQVKSIVKLSSIETLSSADTSVGNLILEIRTSITYYLDHPLLLIGGQGFGGGIPDVYNLLRPWTWMAGYAEIDGIRNNYFKMHLPITEMFVKGGLILLLFYCFVMYSVMKASDNRFKIIFFFMFIMFFYVSKENLLYTMLIYNFLVSEKNIKYQR